jgi:dipeptidyl aminopeptidase/acylaminoacyl peptidase
MASGVKVRSLVDGSTKDIYQSGPDTIVADAVISHDGRNVAFTTGTFGAGLYPPPSAIHVVSSSGGPVRDVAVTAVPAELQFLGMTWSPDDRFLYFTRRPDAHSPFELFRVPAGGGAAESMGLKFEGLRQIEIAPDGRRIAFSAGSAGTEVWAAQGFLPGRR